MNRASTAATEGVASLANTGSSGAHRADDVGRLRACIHDLTSIIALPALGSGAEPNELVVTLLEASVRVLRLDFAYARFAGGAGEEAREMLQLGELREGYASERELEASARAFLASAQSDSPDVARQQIGREIVSILRLVLGGPEGAAELVLGCRRLDFPDDIERLILKVASEQASLGLQGCRLLSEQKRLADELVRQATQSAVELTVANKALKDQLAERVRTESRLSAHEQEARLILENIPAFVIVLTSAGEVEDANTQTLRYLGKTLGELKAWATTEVIHPDDLPRTHEVYRRSIAAGQAYEVEQRLRSSRGDYRWFRACGIPLGADDRRIERWYVLLVDIDDTKRAEEHLYERERQTRAIVESIPAHIAVFAPDGAIEFLNSPLLQYWGRPRENMASWTIYDMVHPDDLATTTQAFTDALRTGNACDVETRLRRFDGAYRWFNSRGLPLRDATGEIARWYFLFLDIDDRKRVEQDLSARDRQLRQSAAIIAEGQRLSQTGTFYWNTVTNELQFSDENCRINGIEPGTPMTMELMASRIHPDDQWLIQEKIEAANRHHQNELEYEIRLQMPDKQVKWVHTTSSRFVNEQGQLEYIGAVRDITERHKAEEALSKLRSELTHMARVSGLGALTASIAHELNQPLAGIITNATTGLRLLSVDPPKVEGALDALRRTARDANRASDVIVRLRAMFSKKEAVSEQLQLNEAAQDVIALVTSELQRNKVSLQTEYAADLPTIYGDRVQLQQVILNLLLNASDAMKSVSDRPREIVLKTELENEGTVRLKVVDAGIGVDPEQAEQLFEPFFTTKSNGMGIGLAVSRTIIERHRGRLWAEPNPGHGATFAFSIPLQVLPRAADGGNWAAGAGD